MIEVDLLEQIAGNVHYAKKNKLLINHMPHKMREAFLSNNVDAIKEVISIKTKSFANESHVVSISLNK